MSVTSLHTTTTADAARPSRTPVVARTLVRLQGVHAGLQARYDAWLRRELDDAETTRAHRHEIGGDFSVLP